MTHRHTPTPTHTQIFTSKRIYTCFLHAPGNALHGLDQVVADALAATLGVLAQRLEQRRQPRVAAAQLCQLDHRLLVVVDVPARANKNACI